MEREKIRVAYIGEAVDNGTMNIYELSSALMALSNLIADANQILNKDNSKIEVRLSAGIERGSFEMVFELTRNITDQILNLFSNKPYSLTEMLGAIGLAATLSGVNLLELYRWIKCRKTDAVEKISNDKVKITIGNESKIFSVGAWELFQYKKISQHIEGVLHPLKKDGVTGFVVKDFETRESVASVSSDEVDYFKSSNAEMETITSTYETVLQIISMTFERNLKWRFDDGESKFYALVTDEDFMKQFESGRINFAKNDRILARIELKQSYDESSTKTERKVIKVLKIFKSNAI